LKRKERERESGLLQVEAMEVISIAEYLNTRYKQDQIVDTVKNHESNQPKMNSAIKGCRKIKPIR